MTMVNTTVAFFKACSEKGIAVMFSLFDYSPPAWAGVSQDQMYVNQSLIARECNQPENAHPSLGELQRGVHGDIKNEPSSTWVTDAQFATWVENISATIRSMDRKHLVVVGGAYGNFENPAPYAPYVDAVCVHFYQDRNMPTWKRDFERYLQQFKATGKPVILQEFGWPTWTAGNRITEQMQADYYAQLFAAADKAGIASIIPWCLWDYTVSLDWSGTGDHSEEHFGLLRTDGSWKPSADVFHAYATGAEMPPLNVNVGGSW